MPQDPNEQLFEHVECGGADEIRGVVAAGADPNCRNEDGETPLTVAIQRGVGDADLVEALLQSGADPSLVDGAGWSPWLLNRSMLEDPVMAPMQRQIRTLLEAAGASRAGEDRFALSRAAREGDCAEVERLLAAGADPDADPFHPLSEAASDGHEDVVAALLAGGAKPNRAESEGHFTPLIRAASDGHLGTVKRLVEAGADPSLEVEGVGNAAEYAEMHGHDEVVRWLEEHGSPTHREVGVACHPPTTARGSALGWRLFQAHADIGNAEHSLLFVQAPIEEVSPALAGELDDAQLFTGIERTPQAIPRRAQPVFVVQLAGQTWTLVVHGMGSIGWGLFEEGRRVSEALAKKQGWKVVYASENDTDCESWFTVFGAAGEAERTRDAVILKREGILLPGFNPYERPGIAIFGLRAEDLRRVDVVA